MKESPSQYGGIAAVLVLGIGLVAVGKTWAGIAVLVAGLLFMAIMLSPTASVKALLVAIGALLCSGVLAYHAASNEITGKAVYHHGVGRGSQSEPVTRKDSPAKFREATHHLWGGSILVLLAGAIAFHLSRKLDTSADDF